MLGNPVRRASPIRAAVLSIALLAFVLGAPERALADEAAQASFHDRRARAAFAQGAYDRALEELFAVQRIAPSAGTTFNIGLCFFYLRRDKEAFFYFSTYLRDAGADAIPQNVAFARRQVERLRAKVAQIRIETEPPGAEVYVDRPVLGSYGRTPLTLPVEAGRRKIWVDKEGYHRAALELVARRGKEVSARVVLRRVEGRLRARSEPPGPLLVLDEVGASVARGASPLDVALRPGVYVVEATPPGHRPSRDIVRIEADRVSEVEARPEPLPPPRGTLTITTNRPGALVEVGGRAVGFAPTVLGDLPVGTASIAIRSDGVEPWVGEVEVGPGARGYLTATLEPPPSVERSPLTWVFGAVGASALAASLVTGILYLEDANELKRLQARPDGNDQTRLFAQASTLRDVHIGLLIGGGVTLGTGLLLYFLTEKTDTRESAASIVWE